MKTWCFRWILACWLASVAQVQAWPETSVNKSLDYLYAQVQLLLTGSNNAVAWGHITGTASNQVDMWSQFTNRFTKAETLALAGVTNLVFTNAPSSASYITNKTFVLGTSTVAALTEETLWNAVSNQVVYTNDVTYTDTVARAASALQSEVLWNAASNKVVYTNDVAYTDTVAKAASALQSETLWMAASNRVVYTNDVTYTDTVAKAASALQTELDPTWTGVSNTVVYTNTPAYTDTVAKASNAYPSSGGTLLGNMFMSNGKYIGVTSTLGRVFMTAGIAPSYAPALSLNGTNATLGGWIQIAPTESGNTTIGNPAVPRGFVSVPVTSAGYHLWMSNGVMIIDGAGLYNVTPQQVGADAAGSAAAVSNASWAQGWITAGDIPAETDPHAVLSDGTRAMTGNLDMGGFSVTNISTGSVVFANGTSISSPSNGTLAVNGVTVLLQNSYAPNLVMSYDYTTNVTLQNNTNVVISSGAGSFYVNGRFTNTSPTVYQGSSKYGNQYVYLTYNAGSWSFTWAGNTFYASDDSSITSTYHKVQSSPPLPTVVYETYPVTNVVVTTNTAAIVAGNMITNTSGGILALAARTITLTYASLTNALVTTYAALVHGHAATDITGPPWITNAVVNGVRGIVDNAEATLTITVGSGDSLPTPYPMFSLDLGGAWTDFELKISTNNFGRNATLRYVVADCWPETGMNGVYEMTTNVYNGKPVWKNMTGSFGYMFYEATTLNAWSIDEDVQEMVPPDVMLAYYLSGSTAVLPPIGTWTPIMGASTPTTAYEAADNAGVVYYYSSWNDSAMGAMGASYGDSNALVYFADSENSDVRAWRKALNGLPISSQISDDTVINTVLFQPSTNFPLWAAWMHKTNTQLVASWIKADALGLETNETTGHQEWRIAPVLEWRSERVNP